MAVGDELMDRLRRLDGPDWLADRRARAAEVLAATELPTSEEEVWRYSRIDDLVLDAFTVPPADLPVGDPTLLEVDVLDGHVPRRAATVVARNGRVVGVDVDERWAAKGLHAGPARPEHAGLLGTALATAEASPGSPGEAGGVAGAAAGDGRRADGAGATGATGATGGHRGAGPVGVLGGDPDPFVALNDTALVDPVVVHVPDGLDLDVPVVVVHVTDGDGTLSCPRLVVHAGADSAVSVIEVQVSADRSRARDGAGDGAGGTAGAAGGSTPEALVVPVTEIVVGRAARVGHVTLQGLGLATWQVGLQVSRVDAEATFRSTSIGFGGGYARLRTDCRLVGRGASGDLDAVFFGEGDQTLDFRTFQQHLAPDTTSDLLFKGAVGGRSRSVYTGMIRVAKSARGTNAFQTNRNIKLSDHAWAESVPNLVIENNDVRCSHASAVGPIDEEQRFYLESRGVPTDVAERLIVGGFFGEVFAKLPVPGLTPLLARTVGTKFERREA